MQQILERKYNTREAVDFIERLISIFIEFYLKRFEWMFEK